MHNYSNHKFEIMLTTIGLKEVMIEKEYGVAFDRDQFHIYTPQEYWHAERREMDEVYRMWESVLLHKTSGLRLEYLITESYYGDEYRYRLRRIFIITRALKSLTVTHVDFSQQLFITPNGNIPFEEVKMDCEGD